MSTLGDEYPKMQARVRALIEVYKEIGPAGTFGRIMIEQVLERADRAAISGDVVAMIRSFKEMEECE
jgi:hypothetical protein